MARHFAAALIRRWNPKTEKFEFLVIHYQLMIWIGKRRPKGHFQIKFPGGKQKFNETPRETVRRECIEEIDLIIRGAIQMCKIETPEGPQYYFLVDFDRCKGKLRTVVHHDRRADLSPPVWVEEDNLEALLHGYHRKAFRLYRAKQT